MTAPDRPATRRPRYRPRIGLALAAALAVAGCTNLSHESSSSAAAPARLTVDAALHDRLPADILARGQLRVVTDASYPPIESFAADGVSIVGVDPDIGAALGAVLGIPVIFRNADFGTLIDLVTAGEADMVMTAMTDTAEREASLDFVDYFAAGTSIVVQRGNPVSVTDLASLCGHPVAVEEGTTQEALIARYQPRCATPITVLTGTTNDDALVLLRTGRVVAVLMDYPPAEWLTTDPKTHAHYELATTSQYEPGLYGIGFAKDRSELRDAVHDALVILLESGRYQEILDHWDVSHGAVSEVSINAASGG